VRGTPLLPVIDSATGDSQKDTMLRVILQPIHIESYFDKEASLAIHLMAVDMMDLLIYGNNDSTVQCCVPDTIHTSEAIFRGRNWVEKHPFHADL
jgi:hypothetical protein